jgi:hypothetical protein
VRSGGRLEAAEPRSNRRSLSGSGTWRKGGDTANDKVAARVPPLYQRPTSRCRLMGDAVEDPARRKLLAEARFFEAQTEKLVAEINSATGHARIWADSGAPETGGAVILAVGASSLHLQGINCPRQRKSTSTRKSSGGNSIWTDFKTPTARHSKIKTTGWPSPGAACRLQTELEKIQGQANHSSSVAAAVTSAAARNGLLMTSRESRRARNGTSTTRFESWESNSEDTCRQRSGCAWGHPVGAFVVRRTDAATECTTVPPASIRDVATIRLVRHEVRSCGDDCVRKEHQWATTRVTGRARTKTRGAREPGSEGPLQGFEEQPAASAGAEGERWRAWRRRSGVGNDAP